jgi:hypothetical protein
MSWEFAVEVLERPLCHPVGRRSPGGSTSAMIGDPTAGCDTPLGAGPSSIGTGIGTEPVTTVWAITMIPPNAPTVSTAAVAAVVVQSTAGGRPTRTSPGGHIRSRKYDSSQSTSDGDISCEDTDPPIADRLFHGRTVPPVSPPAAALNRPSGIE